MDPLLSVLVYSVGAMDIIEAMLYFVAHLRGDQLTSSSSGDIDLDELKNRIRKKIEASQIPENPELTCAQDGTLFKDGFRVGDIDEKGLDQVGKRVEEISEQIQTNDNDNAQFSRDGGSTIEINKIFIEKEAEKETLVVTENCAHVLDESKLRPVSRNDELRHVRQIRTSVSSTSSHNSSRQEEIQALTALELEEQSKSDDFVPIIYEGTGFPENDIDLLETIPEGGSSTGESVEGVHQHSKSPEEIRKWVEQTQNQQQPAVDEPIIMVKRVNLIGLKPEVLQL